MTARDARGRFTNVDTAAAERVLEAAVAEARRVLADAETFTVSDCSGRVVKHLRGHDIAYVREMLLAAGRSAELLMGRAA